ncbi:MAG: ATP-binding cassette domain-containing protein [Bacteroidales bacterium]|jgi:ABC-2 type transport system ATP-binding protein|nr:ATP-binding cassette domain-containing protein [Bacteroidales bacterium]MBR6226891.1 ATP-binding cassette domain-containing protein [Bacteroidales bacterium]
MTKISVNEVTKCYAGHTALDRISIDIPERCIYGLLGPNGAGKTTLIRILNQITMPDTGQVLINGEPLGQRHVASIGYLPEERGLYKKMKVGEQAIYLAELKGIKKAEAQRRLKQWFDKFEIGGWWDKKVEELSKGMQQKVQFITTVIHEPDILIFDEPFSGFDPINANMLKESILELRDKGATILLSTHNMASVEELCDRITLINKGKSILEGKVSDIKRQHDTHKREIVVRTTTPQAIYALGDTYNNIKVEQTDVEDEMRLTLFSATSNDLIAQLLQNGQLVSYKEVLPSMNDIFIQEVQSQNQAS